VNKPQPYIPDIGISVVKKVLSGEDGDGEITDLSLNESSLGASPLATRAAKARAEQLNRYPDPASAELRDAIGRAYGLDPARITCGNGSEELIDAIARIYARPGDEVVFTEYGFMQFPIVAMRVGATPAIAAEKDLTTDVDAMLARVTDKTRIVFLANPNNPTGTYIPRDEVRRLRDGLPGSILLVVDSAYAEYVVDADYSEGNELVEGVENVVVTRTFSKAFGLAALRVGWAYGSASIIGAMNRMRGIGNVNAIAQEAALAALGDLDFVRRVREQTAAERERLCRALTGLGLAVVPSAANFVMARFPSDTNHRAGAALAHMEGRGIILRPVDDYGLDDYLRFTIGLPEENDAVIEGLRSFLV
jgi:histidinol-phosphate aminotransferase